LLDDRRTAEGRKGLAGGRGGIRAAEAPNWGKELGGGRGGLAPPPAATRLHVLQHLALAAELTGRIEVDLEPAAAFCFRNLRHAAPANQQRMLRIKNAADLEGVDALRRGGADGRSEHDESKQCTR